jgi:hypothetical protein
LGAFDMMGNPLKPADHVLAINRWPVYLALNGAHASDLIAMLGLN